MKNFKAIVFLLATFVISSTAQVNTISKKVDSTAPNVKSTKVVTIDTIERDTIEALTLIQDNYVDKKNLDYNELFKSSIDGMLHQLDPHSNYYDAKEAEEFMNDQSSQYFGIGAIIGDLRDPQGKLIGTYIKSTFENAPANRAGLRFGDRILEVNGLSMSGKPFSEVRSNLRGPRGTVAKIKVERYGTKAIEMVEIIRDAVPQPSVPEAYMIRPGVGYIAMTVGFNQETAKEFNDALKELKKQGLQSLIMDLRGNPGGLVREAYRVASTLLKEGQTILTQKGAKGKSMSFASDNPNPENVPIVMLVNRGSASASEILAGALQDHDRALIIGENTFGKALVMNPFQIDYGSMLMLVVARYETPAGRLIQRDYSGGSLYDYQTKGGTLKDENNVEKPKGIPTKTDSGRTVYGGDGIAPDIIVKPKTISNEKALAQQKLLDPLLEFSFNLAFGKVAGFENYKIDKPIIFNHDIKSTDFLVSEPLFQTFKKYATEKYKVSAVLIDREREFIERYIRTELVTAAYGQQTSFQVFNEVDTQLQKAIELIPQAKELQSRAKITTMKTSSLDNK